MRSAPRRLLLIAIVVAPVAAAAPSGDAAGVRQIYHATRAEQLVPLLREAIGYETVESNRDAHSQQRDWLKRTAAGLGFVFRDAAAFAEIELPGPAGAPVLGLVVHGDVAPPGDGWTVPPFAGIEKDGDIYGRGVADDKGPLIQALLAMAALRDSGLPRTHAIRLLVGSDEESQGRDVVTYLRTHAPPTYSLVLDSVFPVVVGEKAWDEFTVTAEGAYVVKNGESAASWHVVHLDAGTATSIVPDRATATLRWRGAARRGVDPAVAALTRAPAPEGYALETIVAGEDVTLTARGHAAHAGMNIEGGRNALVLLAKRLLPHVAPSGARDLLAFAVQAGSDLHGSGLGLTAADSLAGPYDVNVATIKSAREDALRLAINLRRPAPITGGVLRTQLEAVVAAFNRANGSRLVADGYFDETPLAFDRNLPIVRQLMRAYARATGQAAPPAVVGGATYAARLPDSIAFGMWLPGRPYPGHDTDEHVSIAALHRGVDVLIEALVDLSCGAPLVDPFRAERPRRRSGAHS